MKTWFVATSIAIGLMVLIDSSAAMGEKQKKIVACIIAFFYDKTSSDDMETGLIAVVEQPDFYITAVEVSEKYKVFQTPEDVIKFPLKIERGGVTKFISSESYVGSFVGMFGCANGQIIELDDMYRRVDIDGAIPAGHFALIMFTTMAGVDGRVEFEEYTAYVSVFVNVSDKDALQKEWKIINPDADKQEAGSRYCDWQEFHEAGKDLESLVGVTIGAQHY